MSHVKTMNGSFTYKQVTSNTWMSHDTRINESSNIFKRTSEGLIRMFVRSHECMCDVTRL